MNLINQIVDNPKHMGLVTVGVCVVAHFILALPLLVTGGLGVVGLGLTWRAHKKNS